MEIHMKNLLVIVPTRGRPNSSIEFAEEFKKNSLEGTDLVFGLDDDDVTYPKIDGVLYEVGPRLRMNGTLNKIATKYAKEYKYLAFLGDDHRPRTLGWDKYLTEAIGEVGFSYGNDLIQGEKLPTAIVMSSNIVTTLGYMAPPCLVHLYMDNFWMDMGNALGRFFYRNDVILEHMHFSVGKSDYDAGYNLNNSSATYIADKNSYANYKATQFNADLEKLKGLIK